MELNNIKQRLPSAIPITFMMLLVLFFLSSGILTRITESNDFSENRSLYNNRISKVDSTHFKQNSWMSKEHWLMITFHIVCDSFILFVLFVHHNSLLMEIKYIKMKKPHKGKHGRSVSMIRKKPHTRKVQIKHLTYSCTSGKVFTYRQNDKYKNISSHRKQSKEFAMNFYEIPTTVELFNDSNETEFVDKQCYDAEIEYSETCQSYRTCISCTDQITTISQEQVTHTKESKINLKTFVGDPSKAGMLMQDSLNSQCKVLQTVPDKDIAEIQQPNLYKDGKQMPNVSVSALAKGRSIGQTSEKSCGYAAPQQDVEMLQFSPPKIERQQSYSDSAYGTGTVVSDISATHVSPRRTSTKLISDEMLDSKHVKLPKSNSWDSALGKSISTIDSHNENIPSMVTETSQYSNSSDIGDMSQERLTSSGLSQSSLDVSDGHYCLSVLKGSDLNFMEYDNSRQVEPSIVVTSIEGNQMSLKNIRNGNMFGHHKETTQDNITDDEKFKNCEINSHQEENEQSKLQSSDAESETFVQSSQFNGQQTNELTAKNPSCSDVSIECRNKVVGQTDAVDCKKTMKVHVGKTSTENDDKSDYDNITVDIHAPRNELLQGLSEVSSLPTILNQCHTSEEHNHDKYKSLSTSCVHVDYKIEMNKMEHHMDGKNSVLNRSMGSLHTHESIPDKVADRTQDVSNTREYVKDTLPNLGNNSYHSQNKITGNDGEMPEPKNDSDPNNSNNSNSGDDDDPEHVNNCGMIHPDNPNRDASDTEICDLEEDGDSGSESDCEESNRNKHKCQSNTSSQYDISNDLSKKPLSQSDIDINVSSPNRGFKISPGNITSFTKVIKRGDTSLKNITNLNKGINKEGTGEVNRGYTSLQNITNLNKGINKEGTSSWYIAASKCSNIKGNYLCGRTKSWSDEKIDHNRNEEYPQKEQGTDNNVNDTVLTAETFPKCKRLEDFTLASDTSVEQLSIKGDLVEEIPTVQNGEQYNDTNSVHSTGSLSDQSETKFQPTDTDKFNQQQSSTTEVETELKNIVPSLSLQLDNCPPCNQPHEDIDVLTNSDYKHLCNVSDFTKDTNTSSSSSTHSGSCDNKDDAGVLSVNSGEEYKEKMKDVLGIELRDATAVKLSGGALAITQIATSDETYNWTNVPSIPYEDPDDPAFISPARLVNRPIYEQLKRIDWVMGYFSTGGIIEVFIDLNVYDIDWAMDELCRITEQPASKFLIKDNNEEWSLLE